MARGLYWPRFPPPVPPEEEILQILFGSINLTDVELAVSESGVLVPAED
jgi:hypothetical protein